jgi:hypothetical protein
MIPHNTQSTPILHFDGPFNLDGVNLQLLSHFSVHVLKQGGVSFGISAYNPFGPPTEDGHKSRNIVDCCASGWVA